MTLEKLRNILAITNPITLAAAVLGVALLFVTAAACVLLLLIALYGAGMYLLWVVVYDYLSREAPKWRGWVAEDVASSWETIEKPVCDPSGQSSWETMDEPVEPPMVVPVTVEIARLLDDPEADIQRALDDHTFGGVPLAACARKYGVNYSKLRRRLKSYNDAIAA
jgi:hypothetical protein